VAEDLGRGCGPGFRLAKVKIANPARAFRNATDAKGTWCKSRGDGPAGSSRLDLTRRGGFQGDAEIVQASGRGESGFERGIEHVVAEGKLPTGTLECKDLEKILGRDPRPSFEEALKVMGG
jgi:hypothetical protein